MILREIIHRVQEAYSSGTPSDDSRLRNRLIYSKLKSARSSFITSTLAAKLQHFSDFDFQTLPCVEFVETTAHECSCAPVEGCLIYRTKDTLPRPIDGWGRHIIDSVTTIGGDNQMHVYSATTWERKRWKQYDKYTSTRDDYFIRNDYLYLTSNADLVRVLSITGLWEDPIEAHVYGSICNPDPSCDSYLDLNFPMGWGMFEKILPNIVQELQVFTGHAEDATNNARDNVKTK